MSKENDAVIAKLTAKIELKRGEIGPIKRFAPRTNCSLMLDGQRYNLHALDGSALIILQVKILNLIKGCDAIEGVVAEEVQIEGSFLTQWYSDIESKRAIAQQSAEVKKLKVLESRLAQLMSEDAKAEKELEEIEKLLN